MSKAILEKQLHMQKEVYRIFLNKHCTLPVTHFDIWTFLFSPIFLSDKINDGGHGIMIIKQAGFARPKNTPAKQAKSKIA